MSFINSFTPIILVLVSYCSGSAIPNIRKDNVVLQIPQGQLASSAILKSRGDLDYYAFYKVPFAKPPLGNLRFASPQPPGPWIGIRNETEIAPQCIQRLKYSEIVEAGGEEDCLYANIYTPKLPGVELNPEDELLPTLFYIHGGGFTDGNGSRYGAKYFMQEDVVLITFQYRLAALGFLSSEDGVIKGNNGFKDQIQALKWTKQNIHFFGGDPNRIMIYGNSAGAMSVNLLMVSPMASGLFHSAITQSGVGVGSSLTPAKELQLKSYESVARQENCWSINSTEVLQCLREKDAGDLAVIRDDDIFFLSTVESYESDDESDKFLPDSWYNLFKTGSVNKVPWILGINNAEYIHVAAFLLSDINLVSQLNNNWLAMAPYLFANSYANSPARDIISNKSREFYFGDKPLSNETLWELTYLLSDRDIIHGSKFQGAWMSELDDAQVFFYSLSKRPQKSYSDGALIGYPEGDYGAAHADELQFLFDYYGYPEYLEGEYYEFSRKLVKTWMQFAATGNPGWDSVKPGQRPLPYYDLNDEFGYTSDLEERMKFWDQFTDEELVYP